MAIYVDPLQAVLRNANWRWPKACHMIADTLTELQRFAEQLGLKRSWFQGPPRHSIPHYDLTPGMRAKAVRMGAEEVDRFAFVEKARTQRDKSHSPTS